MRGQTAGVCGPEFVRWPGGERCVAHEGAGQRQVDTTRVVSHTPCRGEHEAVGDAQEDEQQPIGPLRAFVEEDVCDVAEAGAGLVVGTGTQQWRQQTKRLHARMFVARRRLPAAGPCLRSD